MASGYGLAGGPSRCFSFWQEVLACYVVNAESEDGSVKKCIPVYEDYQECLHHKKERARAQAIQTAYRRAEQQQSKENVPSADEIRSLGLLKASHEKMDLWHGKWLPTLSRNN